MSRRPVGLLAVLLGAGTTFVLLRHRDPAARMAKDLDALISKPRLAATMTELSKASHRAGTPANRDVGEAILRQLGQLGLTVSTQEYGLDLPDAGPSRLYLGERELDFREKPVEGDPFSAAADAETPFFAYAPDGDVTAPVVYANFGEAADYEALKKAGVSVKGKLVLLRAQGACRGMKSLLAEKEGVGGLLIFPELRDQGFKKEPFPAGSHLNDTTVQRGSMLRYFLYPGDPATSPVKTLPTIPALPVTPMVARELLQAIEGKPAPEEWTGWMTAPYRLGESRTPVRLSARGAMRHANVRNIFALLPGTDPALPPLLLFAHYDAWVHGTVDPCSGAATVLEAASALAALRQRAWKPTRSVLFAFWDAEEYGMIGSTKWVEERLANLPGEVAAALYVDSSFRARGFMGNVVPGLRGAIDAALRHVIDPDSGKPLFDVRGTYGAPGFSGDTAPFLGLGRIPAGEIGFGRSYALYHSVYDDMTWMAKYGDKGMEFTATLTKILALFAREMTDGPVLPFRLAELASASRDTLRDDAKVKPVDLLAAIDAFEKAAVAWDALAPGRRRLSAPRAREVEKRLQHVRDAFATSDTAFGENDLLLAPAELNLCAGEALPRLRRALRAKDGARQDEETKRLAAAFREAARRLSDPALVD